ncbi:MAG: AAA family ATPase, partial [Chthoniobacteraceae bacterium]
ASIDLADHLVFAGPNNSGKTTAIQALALWQLALLRWLEKREKTRSKATLRTGVPVSRPDLTVLPLRDTRMIWSDCIVQDSENQKVRLEILVEGGSDSGKWVLGMELEYSSSEQVYVRPMRVEPDKDERMAVPDAARNLRIMLLPALAGLQRIEDRTNERTIRTRISEARAGDVLRNLLYNVAEKQEGTADWEALSKHVADLFQVELLRPQFLGTGEVQVEYHNGLRPRGNGRNPHPKLDLAMAGSGFHQVLLLLAVLYGQPGDVLLFDEPDAHLEIIRQRDVYALLRRLAVERRAQLIVCTHSEKILDETDSANVRAFLGDTPRPLTTKKEADALRKALTRIPSADYLQAKEREAVLYLEDYTDLEILRSWAEVLTHEKALEFLKSPFVHYVGNVAAHARDHFYGLHGAHPQLRGLLLIDQTDLELQGGVLVERMWTRREIENYLLVPPAILRFCEAELRQKPEFAGIEDELFAPEFARLKAQAGDLLQRRMLPAAFDAPFGDDPFLIETKASDVVLEPFFKEFFAATRAYNTMPKKSFFRLAAIMKPGEVHSEVGGMLDLIGKLAR